MSLKTWWSGSPPSVEDALELVEEAKRAEQERKQKAEADAKAKAKAIAELARGTEPSVVALERRVGEALAVEGDGAVSPLPARRLARRYLRGDLNDLPELLTPEGLLAEQDRRAATLFGLAAEAVGILERVSGVYADVRLPGDHELMVRVDACEVAAWSALMQRVHEIAGEQGRPSTPAPALVKRGRRVA